MASPQGCPVLCVGQQRCGLSALTLAIIQNCVGDRMFGKAQQLVRGRMARHALAPLIVGALAFAGSAAKAADITQLLPDGPIPAIILLIVGLAVGALVMALLKRAPRAPIDYEIGERKIFSATIQIGAWIGAFGIVGIIALAIAGYGMGPAAAPAGAVSPAAKPDVATQFFSSVFGVDLMAAAAAAAVGALLGFIFGIPRTLDPASRAAVAGAAAQAGPSATSHAVLGANTNLERISDWLSTLLIGATLVQINDIIAWIGDLGKNLAAGAITNQRLVPILVVYFFTLAFLGIYLITRLYLTTALTQTLSMLAGGDGVSELGILKAKLAGASSLSDSNDLKSVVGFYRSWPLRAEQRSDPELNAAFARVLVRYLGTKKADDVSIMVDLLKGAVANASADATQKARLKAELAKGTLKTGDDTIDADLAKWLG